MNLKSVVKLVLALTIPTVIGSFWYYSQKQANLEVENYNKDQKDHPTTDRTTVKNYKLQEVSDDNELKWQLFAKEGVVMSENHDVLLQKVSIQYFDGKNIKMEINAPVGKTNEDSRDVILNSTDKQKVEVLSESGKTKLSADKISINSKNDFEASKDVSIKWANQASVFGNTISGSFKDSGFNNLTVKGNTHAVLACKQTKVD